MPGAPPSSRPRGRTNSSLPPHQFEPGSLSNGGQETTEVQNARALEVLARVAQKLTGRDFKVTEELEVDRQVDKLIIEATNLENLCQHYVGWCPFW